MTDKQKVVVPTARRHIAEIADFIAGSNPETAERYIDMAYADFFNLPDLRRPARASEKLPDDVRQLHVDGFRGYTLRLLYRGDFVALVAAFRPGLTEGMRDRDTMPGLAEFRRDYPEG